MRLGFDLDGTTCDGRYLTCPERCYESYLGLAPYDEHTVRVWNELCNDHVVYVITARSYDEQAWRHIHTWFGLQGMDTPAGIITHIDQANKVHLAHELKLDHYFDDSPTVYISSQPWINTWLMNNPIWPENQQLQAGNGRINSWKEIETIIATDSNQGVY